MFFSETDIYTATVPLIGEVRYDPLALRRRLLTATSGRCWQYVKDAAEFEKALATLSPDNDSDSDTTVAQRAEWSMRHAEIEGLLAEAAFAAFNLMPYDPDTNEGTTETAALKVLQDFVRWVEEKKGRAAT